MNSFRRSKSSAFTLMEAVVAAAIIVVLAAIIYPVWRSARNSADRQTAMSKMVQLGNALAIFRSANNDLLPHEESPAGQSDWSDAEKPEAANAWYNALPRAIGMKGLADYSRTHTEVAFYEKESIFFIAAAKYPSGKKLVRPLFAVAFNTKLHRKNEAGEKAPLRYAQIDSPSRTVAFLEQGIRGEPRAFPQFMDKYGGGDPKASARQFIARYSGETGLVAFLDGHVEPVKVSRVLEPGGKGGRIVWNPADASGIFWTADINEDPN